MPRYDYYCPQCGKRNDVWASIREEWKQCVCGWMMKRLFSPPTNIICDIEPYLDDHMDAKPIWVESRQHRNRLLKERGLAIK